jgi:UDPglucose 6-dehydrogenase
LARDLRFLTQFGRTLGVETPLFDGVMTSNDRHKRWTRDKVAQMLKGVDQPIVSVLGLTYKPGTDTLRRSTSIELCMWMAEQGYRVKAYDPAVSGLPGEYRAAITLTNTPAEALQGSNLAVVATEWPEFRNLMPEDFLRQMRRPAVIDPNWFLAPKLISDRKIHYVTTGRDSQTV